MKTAKEIAEKYVKGKHDALTDNQEIIDMTKDIEEFSNRLWGVFSTNDELLAIHKTLKGAEKNCKNYNNGNYNETDFYVDLVYIHH